MKNSMYRKFEEFMQERGLSPYKVSKEAHVSQPTLSDWKRGKSEPKRATLEKICSTYEIPITYFYEDDKLYKEKEDTLSDRDKRIMAYAEKLLDLGIDPDNLEALIDAVEKIQKKD